MHIKLKNKKGQSTVEYVLLVTAVLAVIIAFVANPTTSPFQNEMNTTLGAVTNDIGSEGDQLTSSHSPQASVPASPEINVDITQ